MDAMRRLEAQFGKPHPELEGYKPLHSDLQWLETSFFRLHRRRQASESGIQPLSYQDITHFADRVIELPCHLVRTFTEIMEVTDHAVVSDYYAQQKGSR